MLSILFNFLRSNGIFVFLFVRNSFNLAFFSILGSLFVHFTVFIILLLFVIVLPPPPAGAVAVASGDGGLGICFVYFYFH